MISLLKKPAAWLPIALSLIFWAAMMIGFMLFGVPARQSDEGTGAHLFQIWLVLEALLIIFFTAKWLPKEPKWTLAILALQILSALLVLAPVFILKL